MKSFSFLFGTVAVFVIALFSLPALASEPNNPAQQSDVYGYGYVSVKPTFQDGDMTAFTNWLYEELMSYGEQSGSLIYQFVVDETGKVGDVKTLRSNNEALSKIIIEIIEKCPDWKPGSNGGKAVKTRIMGKISI